MEEGKKYSYDYPKGLMDGSVRIFLDDICTWGKCFQGYGGCGSRAPVFKECKVWNIPKILREIKKALRINATTKFFLETPNFFESEKMLNEKKYQFQELIGAIRQHKIQAYFSVQTTPRELIYFLEDEDDHVDPEIIRQVGIQEIWLGVESANPELRNKYGKPWFDNSKLEKVMVRLRQVGINCCFYLVVSSDDTDETIRETVDFVRKTKPAQICPFDLFHFFGGEHYIDWETVRAHLDKIARYQKVLRDLEEEINTK